MTISTNSVLPYLHNICSPERLEEIYETDYYWYLKSPEFKEAFLKPLGEQVSKFQSVLDVGCGEGQLAEFVGSAYFGIDGSLTAVRRARVEHPRREFTYCRLDDPRAIWWFDCLVFGGILEVLVKPDCRTCFIEHYLDLFQAKAFFVYDLARLDTRPLDEKYERFYEYEATVEMPTLQENKQHRIIRGYRCKS